MSRAKQIEARKHKDAVREQGISRFHAVPECDMRPFRELPREVWDARVATRWVLVRARTKDLVRLLCRAFDAGHRIWLPTLDMVRGDVLVGTPLLPGSGFVGIQGTKDHHDCRDRYYQFLAEARTADALLDIRAPILVCSEANVARFRDYLGGRAEGKAIAAPRFRAGDKVQVTEGPMRGIDFEIDGIEGDQALIKTIDDFFACASKVSVPERCLTLVQRGAA